MSLWGTGRDRAHRGIGPPVWCEGSASGSEACGLPAVDGGEATGVAACRGKSIRGVHQAGEEPDRCMRSGQVEIDALWLEADGCRDLAGQPRPVEPFGLGEADS